MYIPTRTKRSFWTATILLLCVPIIYDTNELLIYFDVDGDVDSDVISNFIIIYNNKRNTLTLIGTRFSPHVKNQEGGGVKKHPRGKFAISRKSDVRFR